MAEQLLPRTVSATPARTASGALNLKNVLAAGAIPRRSLGRTGVEVSALLSQGTNCDGTGTSPQE